MTKVLETVECKVCSNPMPKLRKELYGYDFCVKCSTVMPKVGRVVTYGEGEDTWNDLEILDQEQAKRILELEQLDSRGFNKFELLDYNQEELDSEVSCISNSKNFTFEYDTINDEFDTQDDDDEDEEEGGDDFEDILDFD